jgi:hypothetical protein
MKVNFFNNPLGPGEVKYSLLARKVTLRGTTRGMKIESLNERWFDAMITGPWMEHVVNREPWDEKPASKLGSKMPARFRKAGC